MFGVKKDFSTYQCDKCWEISFNTVIHLSDNAHFSPVPFVCIVFVMIQSDHDYNYHFCPKINLIHHASPCCTLCGDVLFCFFPLLFPMLFCLRLESRWPPGPSRPRGGWPPHCFHRSKYTLHLYHITGNNNTTCCDLTTPKC